MRLMNFSSPTASSSELCVVTSVTSSAYHFSALLVTDVTTQSSLLLAVGDEKFIKRIDYPRLEPGIYELRDVVSRKKQLLPYLTHCLRETEKGVKG